MKTRPIAWLLVAASCLFYACQKEQVINSSLSQQHRTTQTILVDGSENQAKSGNPDDIILGNDLPNPYAHDNVLAAFNTIYPNHQRTSLTVTHHYIKFLPQDWDALEALQEAIDAFEGQANPMEEHDPYLFNYPIHKEVIQQGIYYHDPSIAADLPSYHYAVVPPDFQAPAGVSVEVLEELVQVPYNTYIMAEAFRRVGATYYATNGQVMTSCTPSCPNYPQCYDPAVNCNTGEVQPLPVPCAPNTTWYQCGVIFIPTVPSSTTGGTNSCGCTMNEEANQPSGCVQVEDTQLGWEGVRNIKVYVKDLYFFGRETWTTHSGCWSIPYSYFGGIHPFLNWYNSKVEFRAMRDGYAPQLGEILKQNCGTHGGGIYNDFQIRHNRFSDNSKIEKAHWAASTGLNALYEFDAYAIQESIGGTNGSPLSLRVWVINSGGGGAAPMLKDLVYSLPNQDATSVGTSYVGSYLLPTLDINYPTVRRYLPDVVYFYGTTTRSDAMKSTYYHEYAHVAHYRGIATADRYSYWMDNIQRTLDNVTNNDNPPYGNPTTTGAGRTAIIEAWGEHIGFLFGDKRYGTNCFASSLQQDPDDKERARYIYRTSGLEQFNPNSSSPDAWIPAGVFWDLLDDNVHNQAPLFVNDPVIDNIQGVSNSIIFSAVTQNAPTEITMVRDAIKANTTVNHMQIDDLFLEYGY